MRKKRIISLVIVLSLILGHMSVFPSYAAINGQTPGLNVKVTDNNGDKPEYTGSNKILTNDDDIKLNGDAFVRFKSDKDQIDLNNVEYKFFKQDSQPTDFSNEEGWEKLDPNKNTIQKLSDVMTDKQGYLKWRSYNVDHMPTLSGNNKWSNRAQVYKNPRNEIKYQNAKTARNRDEYIKKVGRKLETYTVFMPNMKIGQIDKFKNYKEASKFWGYIKVDETADYRFAIKSDDGSYGYIIVDGNEIDIVDRTGFFKPQGSTFGSTNKIFHLEKDKYYPIYLEYFNWGGSAHFQLYYRENGRINNGNKVAVPKEWFYPSKTNTPGEYADSTFVINEGVEFPKEPGKYYIGLKNDSNGGVYGPFIVAPKATLNLERKAVNGNDFIVPGENFEFKYTINPQPIPIDDVGDSSRNNQLIVKNFKVQETFPDDISIVSSSQGQINRQIFTSTPQDITYTKNTSSGNYEAPEVSITVQLKTDKELNDFVLGSEEKAFATYTDLDDADAQRAFEEIKLNTTKLEELNILEVQPNRNFELNQNYTNLRGMAKTINLTQMSMPEFISKVDKVNGKYDIVYIGNNGDSYTHIGNRPNKLPQNGHRNGSESEEYYSENDITNKRAGDLKEFIESGQLIMFDDSIFDYSLSQTKLYNNFKQYESRENVKLTDNIFNENIKHLYDVSNKRPILNITSYPQEYDGTGNGYKNDKNMSFTFNLENLNTSDNASNFMIVKLYCDENGDGLFKEDEIVYGKQGKLLSDGEGYVINHSLSDYFTGMMPWKLEVEDIVTNTKSYKIGHPAYKGEKLKIRVLQLIPPKGNSFSIKNMKVPLNTDYYDVEVTELKTTEFNSNYPSPIKKGDKTINTELNGNYDMVILGFKDGFEDGDLEIEPINGIKEFIRTNQSVMFTHDTMSYHVNNYGRQCKNLTQQFRDIIGQSRYNNNPIKNNNNISYDNDEYYSDEIVHDPLPNSNKTSYGFTKGILDVKNNVASDHPKINKTYKLNEGLYTRYPYILANNAQNQLNVATTHEQYFQLNLEDEDIIPWFTLDGESSTKLKNSDHKYVYDKYDGRNNYYTYTKGNITYSGTGHSSPDGTGNKLDEHKMFMNTIMKASRSANHAPTLEVLNFDENNIISRSQEQFEFSFIADDIDGDSLTGEIYINDELVRRYDEGELNLKEPVNVSITKGELQQNVGSEEQFTVKIVIKDSKGAIAQENGDFNLKYLDNPVLSLSIKNEQKYLVGDTVSATLKASTQKTSDNLNTQIQNINYKISIDNSNGGITVSDTNWNLNNITFNPDPKPAAQEKTFDFTVNKPGNYNINNTLTYDYSNFKDLGTQTTNYNYPISVRQGKVNVQVLNNDGTAFANANVRVSKQGGGSQTVTTDEHGFISLERGLTGTGTYELSVENLDSKYVVKEGSSKTINLSYDDAVQDVKFEIIDKTKIGINLSSEGNHEYLVGDRADITLKAVAQNEDEKLITTIENIKYSLDYDEDALDLTTDNNWELKDVNINGTEILNDKDKEQTKTLSFNIKKAGTYEIANNISYKYLENISEVRNAVHEIRVKSGRINVKVVDYDGTPCEDIEVTVTKDGKVVNEGNTDSLGKYSLSDKSSGQYKVAIDLPGFDATGGNSTDINLSYNNPVEDITFKLDNSVQILDEGIFVNKEFAESQLRVVKGYDVDLGIKFRVFSKKSEVRLNLGENINKIEFILYKLDENGNLGEPIKNNVNVYKVAKSGEDEETFIKLGNANEIIDLSSISGEKSLKVEIPESDTLENKYILEYKISQNAEAGKPLKNEVTINKLITERFDIEVIPLPSLD